jgi:hypothetical protein
MRLEQRHPGGKVQLLLFAYLQFFTELCDFISESTDDKV